MAIANLEKIYIGFRKSIVLRIDIFMPFYQIYHYRWHSFFYIVLIFAIANAKTTLHTYILIQGGFI